MISNQTTATGDRILRIPEVCQRTGLSRATIYTRIRSGDFPPRIKLGPRAMGFRESALDRWINERPELVEGAL